MSSKSDYAPASSSQQESSGTAPDSGPCPDESASPSDAVWKAFDAALTHAHAALDGESAHEDLIAFLRTVRDSVASYVAGAEPPPHCVTSPVSAARVVECVRLAFIDEVHAAQTLNHQRAIGLLAALGQLQHSISEGTPEERALYRSGEQGALGLAVEIAHDMRSPLTAILFLIDMMRSGRSGAVTPVQARQLAIVYGAAFGLNQLATDLIDHVKGHDRSIERQAIPFSVTELLNSVCDILAPMSEERSLEIRIVTLPNDARVGFPTALNRVLLNLATNALKYTPKGSVTIAARQLKGSQVEFCVADSGPGISRHVRDQIFRPFRTAGRTERQSFSSSGLGLSICRNLVHALGGELRVSSTLGSGTKFSFVLDMPHATSD